MNDGPFVQAALEVVRNYKAPVFPVEPRGKRPIGSLVPHWKDDATLDEDKVRFWGRDVPDANVAVVTGASLDALDIDGLEGMAATNAALPWPDNEPWDDTPTGIDGPTVCTGTGWHVYVAPTGLGNRAGWLPHCDWRGAGGYVIAAGSVHPSGARYEYFPNWGPEREIRPAPAWVLELLKKPASSIIPNRQACEPPNRTRAYAQRALESEVGRVVMAPEGQRNDTLNRAAHALGQLVAAKVLDLGIVIQTLEDAGMRTGLSFDEVRATIRSGLRAGMSNPRKLSR